MVMDEKASDLLIKGYHRERLTKDDCRYLLSFQEFSPEATFARDLFTRFFREQCDNTAAIGAQIGVYTGPCSGDWVSATSVPPTPHPRRIRCLMVF